MPAENSSPPKKRFAPYFFPVLASILLAAHFSRIQNDALALGALAFPMLLLIKKGWILRIYQGYLLAGGIIWMERLVFLREQRIAAGEPWLRLALIMFVVAHISFITMVRMQRRRFREIYFKSEADNRHTPTVLAAFLATGTLLTVVHFQVSPPILLLERFLPGAGMLEVAALALYAAWITEKMLVCRRTAGLRLSIWTLFSLVFFLQFILGLAGIEPCLMTGDLHLPVPALIIAGPVFRGAGFFMPILFAVTVILAGAAWCSHLCYVGNWDNFSARLATPPRPLPRWWLAVRTLILILIVTAAYSLRSLGIDGGSAALIAVLYGLLGVAVMIVISRRMGTMAHCTVYCPIGLAADLLGRINPFRIRFTPDCDGCQACRSVCRYHALTEKDIQRRKPGLSCTLCGDCLESCRKEALVYSFPGLKPGASRKVFIILIITLHAIFLGIARI